MNSVKTIYAMLHRPIRDFLTMMLCHFRFKLKIKKNITRQLQSNKMWFINQIYSKIVILQ